MKRAVLVGAVAALGLAQAASAFVVQGPRRSTGDAVEDFRLAPRWDAGAGALIADGVRGLGGGLEYAVDDSVCGLRFLDAPDCDDARAMIAEAARRWADGNAALRFEDVTGFVAPSPPRGRRGERVEGAESDIFAAGSRDFPRFANRAITAYTVLYSEPAALVAAPGGEVRALDGRASSADLWINADRCYYLDPGLPAPGDCVHFGAMLQHEFSHVLGLDHPDAAPRQNLDTNLVAGDPLVFDCRDPAASLVVNPAIDRRASTIGENVHSPERWLRGLSPDDLGGRDALYPVCGAPLQVADAYSTFETNGACLAFANGPGGLATGRGPDPQSAQTAARRACGPDCAAGEAVCFSLP